MILSVAILAAGQSSRYNGIKQMASIENSSMLKRCISMLELADVGSISVMLGAYADIIIESLDTKTTVVNVPNWSNGLSESIKLAVTSAPKNCTHLMLVLADQVALTCDDIQLLVASSKETPDIIVASRYENSLGVPVIFPRHYFQDLLSLQGDRGANKLINSHDSQVCGVDLPNAVVDIDTNQQLCNWLKYIK